MARPRYVQSIEGATGTELGEAIETGGRQMASLYVEARNLDANNDSLTVRLEGRFEEGQQWAKLMRNATDDIGRITQDDMGDPDDSGDFAVLHLVNAVCVEEIRADIEEFDDNADGDLEVDVYVGVSNNPGGAHNFREV